MSRVARTCLPDVVLMSSLHRWIISSEEPALPLHLQDIWNFNPSKVGLVYIAAVVPTLFCTSLAHVCP